MPQQKPEPKRLWLFCLLGGAVSTLVDTLDPRHAWMRAKRPAFAFDFLFLLRGWTAHGNCQ
ncbi:hypothetical protein, partial [Stenotrophomonas maltophilia]|uniref:hypothetical protein n=1 Tax=Stenotrophomonas maltophilia TaxID=40324 RepID=UPI001C60DF4D